MGTIGSGRTGRLTLVACALLLARCESEVTERYLPPLPPFSASCQSEGKDVFVASAAPAGRIFGRPPEEQILRSRYVTVNFDVLTAAGTPGDVVRLNLFEDVCFDAVLTHLSPAGPIGQENQAQGWGGTIRGNRFSSVGLTFGSGRLTGTVSATSASPRHYQVSHAAGGVHGIYETDGRRSPPVD